MDYSHNNTKLKKIQHNTEKLVNKTRKTISKITPATQEVELVLKTAETPRLPKKVN